MHDDLEVIGGDDGSSDHTATALAALRPGRRLRYFRQRNLGVAAARNTGIRAATGSWISFLDSDDLWKPFKLECEHAFLSQHPEVDAVFSDLEKYDGSHFTPSFMRDTPALAPFLRTASYPAGIVLDQRQTLLWLLEDVPIKPSALTVRRTVLQGVGGFAETLRCAEDWDLLLRMARRHTFGYVDRVLAVLRISGDSLHRTGFVGAQLSMRQLLSRHASSLDHDQAAVDAARRGIGRVSKHLAWHLQARRQRAAATAALLRGYLHTRDFGLLLRAIGVWMPSAWI